MIGGRTERSDTGRPLEDGAVVARVLSGDRAAFELLMRRYNERLFRVARAALGRDADAEDALQEAYLRAFGALAKFEGRSSISTWLTRIVFREALRLREARSRRPVGGAFAADGGHPERAGHGGTRMDTRMEERLEQRDELARFDAALATLGDRERAIVMLRWVQGLSTRQTALSLGVSQSSVKVALHRARPKLARILEAQGLDRVRRDLTFDGQRCDRLVARVLEAIEHEHADRS